MRRMITNKQVVNIVNEAIDAGEIEMEGGLPEIQEGDAGKILKVNEQEDGVEWAEGGAANALVLPEVAPAAQQLVGINTSGEQNSLGIGDGLEIANGELKAEAPYIVFDFNNSSQYRLLNDMYDSLFANGEQNFPIMIKVIDSTTSSANNMIYKFDNKGSNTYRWNYISIGIPESGNTRSVTNATGLQYTGKGLGYTLTITKESAGDYHTVNLSELTGYAGDNTFSLKNGYYQNFTATSGAFSQAANYVWTGFAVTNFTWTTTIDNVQYYVHFNPQTYDVTNKKLYCVGYLFSNTPAITKTYILVIDSDNKTYSITEVQ